MITVGKWWYLFSPLVLFPHHLYICFSNSISVGGNENGDNLDSIFSLDKVLTMNCAIFFIAARDQRTEQNFTSKCHKIGGLCRC